MIPSRPSPKKGGQFGGFSSFGARPDSQEPGIQASQQSGLGSQDSGLQFSQQSGSGSIDERFRSPQNLGGQFSQLSGISTRDTNTQLTPTQFEEEPQKQIEGLAYSYLINEYSAFSSL